MNYTLIMGIATAFNFIIVLWKFQHNRVADATLDTVIFIAISYLMSGTITGMTIGMIASAIVSLYLLIFPPTLPNMDL